MKTKRYQKEQIHEIVSLLKENEVVAFPTDTVYGAAIRYDSIEAINKLKEAKQRPETKPFPMMVADMEQIEMVTELTDRIRHLMERFMPGAITIVVKKRESVPDEVTNGLSTIALRMPDDDWVREIIQKTGVPLLVPSANISGEPSCTTSDEVLNQLDGRIAAVVEGQSKGSLSSTIVDVSSSELKILREGPVSFKEIKKVWNKL